MNKSAAFKAWSARLKAKDGSRAAADEMLAGTKRYASWCLMTKREPDYIKQPATFFGKNCHFRDTYEVRPRRATPPAPDYTAGIGEDGRIL